MEATNQVQVSHTPGPWEVKDRLVIWPSGAVHIAAINAGAPAGALWNEWEANARLIAAAPSLLEALEDALKQFEGTPWAETEGYERAVAIAKKARGES